jgi:hypothetical protein
MTEPTAPTANGPLDGGLTLQRGGEELLLEKVGDRFTTRLQDAAGMAALTAQLHPHSTRPVAQGQLVEWVVDETVLESALATARSQPAVSFASHVYRAVASPQTWIYLLNDLTVQFDSAVTPAARRAITQPLG